MNSKTATVVHGPAVWLGRSGPVIFESDDEVVVQLEGQDDAGRGWFVRMPRDCVEISAPWVSA
jgi:hypothetical protein